MDNPEELATYGTVHKTKKNKTKSQHNTCWTPRHVIDLKSTCDVNLLSKLSIIFKEWRVIVLFVLLRSHKGQTI
jgi:hypothetical protein